MSDTEVTIATLIMVAVSTIANVMMVVLTARSIKRKSRKDTGEKPRRAI